MNLTGTRGKPGTVPGVPLKGLKVLQRGTKWMMVDIGMIGSYGRMLEQ
jgi:hypothetical protein